MTMHEPRHVESPAGAVQVLHGTGTQQIDARPPLLWPGPARRRSDVRALAMKVCIIQPVMKQYRVPLFEALRMAIVEREIDLDLLVGQGTSAEGKKCDAGELHWPQSFPTRYRLGWRLCWQSFHRQLADIDLLIVTQENRLIQS